jgi:hypothetical protein
VNTHDVKATIVQLLNFVTSIKEIIMVNKKKEPKKVVRKVKKSGLVKLKPSLSEDIKKAKVGRPKKIPTKREAYAKHIRDATVKSQNRTNDSRFRDFIDAVIDTIKQKLGIK